MDYLKEIGKEDSYFQGVQNNFENVGGFSAGDFGWSLETINFDFTVP